MKKLRRVAHARPAIHEVLKVSFDDDYLGVVDLRPLIAKGKIFEWLSAPAHFAGVRIDEFRLSVSWLNDQGAVIDLSADALHRDAERQADLHRVKVS